MLLLAPVVFVGIVGNHHEAVEHQLEPSLEKVGISELAIPDDDRAAIVKHTAASKKVIKSLHVAGVVAGQLAGSGNSRTFRVLIYDGDGNLSTDLESPIPASGMSKDNVTMFEANIADIAAAAAPARSRAPAGKAGRVDGAPLSKTHTDDDAPPGLAGASKASPRLAAATPDDDSTTAEPAVVAHAGPPSDGEHRLHLRVGLLVGVVGRNLSTDPNTVQNYSSSPVGTAGVEGMVGYGDRVHLAGSFEHTLVMHTPVGSASASTDIGRFEVLASYDVMHNAVRVAPAVGFGERYFAVDSQSTARSPDVAYFYAMVGGTVSTQLGSRWTLRGVAAYEPVVGGLTPGMLPDPGRWGFDLGTALEVRATSHLFARAAFDYQLFSSSWTKGGAKDGYPTGSASAGAVF
jgi:hypothetical protein